MNKNTFVPIIVAVAVLAIGGFFYYQNNQFADCISARKTNLSSQDASQKAINYINTILEQRGMASSLVSSVEESGLYKFHFKINEQEYDSYISKDGKILFENGIDISAPQPEITIGNFSDNKGEICSENGKPIVYFFGSNQCPHCLWEHPVAEKVLKNFEGMISFHNNMDSEQDMDVFSKYSSGGIPTIVLGCRYFRSGSGEQVGEDEESKVLTALICDITGNQPSDVCAPVRDMLK